jgi:hypothetical protein
VEINSGAIYDRAVWATMAGKLNRGGKFYASEVTVTPKRRKGSRVDPTPSTRRASRKRERQNRAANRR